jgi:beta-lactamase class A
VRNSFRSALPGAPEFSLPPGRGGVWDRMGGHAPLSWLAERMITRSSNLAGNLLLEIVGLDAVAEVWSLVGARHSAVRRPLEDLAARAAGITNEVTAADLAALLTAIATGNAASCGAMRSILEAQEHREDLAAGLPPGTRVAHKNGWVTGVRHAAGVVYPDDAPPYTLVVCATTPLARAPTAPVPDDDCRLVAALAAASWQDRHSFE